MADTDVLLAALREIAELPAVAAGRTHGDIARRALAEWEARPASEQWFPTQMARDMGFVSIGASSTYPDCPKCGHRAYDDGYCSYCDALTMPPRSKR